ncbi:MAG: substrate-binding domain-containing protein [Thermoflexales bacterium]|nr:substrate-binding domain-containing protein [Thermoflexales bacterium]MCS7325296.1 substrate-binding domain-containing protein [Thermoflexales bacterium]MCX7938440.1 substrate-binding domain-containing protein [Thermoflexales bacterium]MDW8053044.1 substrate-binding domain-containing protein [Anaerolineae bacterium]MDW8291697.1 substrate-binding domain-containing protein [Anaerolineae bacterium]
MRHARPFALLGIALLGMLSACSRVEPPRTTPTPRQYHLVADAASAPLLRTLAETYAREHPHLMFIVESGDAALVETRLRAVRTRLAATTLLPPPPAPGVQWWFVDAAMDAVTVIVHKDNPVQSLPLYAVRAIFAGERNQWAEYGASALGDIKVAVREAGDSTRLLFDQLIMGDVRLTLEAVVMPTPETMMNYVALNPGAIGYAPGALVARTNLPIRALALEGVLPTPETIASGSYPLAHTVYFVAAREPTDELRAFVLWSLSPAGQQVAAAQGYAPLTTIR